MTQRADPAGQRGPEDPADRDDGLHRGDGDSSQRARPGGDDERSPATTGDRRRLPSWLVDRRLAGGGCRAAGVAAA